MKPSSNFSIIIPTRNRAELLERCLQQIESIAYPKEKFEVVVVSNGSTDNTLKFLRQFQKKFGKARFKVVQEKKIGIATARNTGLKHAQFATVVFVDDDVLVSSDVLKRYDDLLQKYPDVSLIGGKIIAVSSNQPKLEKLLRLFRTYRWVLAHSERSTKKTQQLRFPDSLPSANICLNLKLIGTLKFDEDLGKQQAHYFLGIEDHEFCLRLLLTNHKILYAPELVSHHVIAPQRLSYQNFFKQFYVEGKEQRWLDKKLSIYPRYASFCVSPSSFYNYMHHLVFREKLRPLKIFHDFLFISGYLSERVH